MNAPRAETTLTLEIRSVDDLLDVEGSPLVGPRIHPEAARSLRAQASECPRRLPFCIAVKVPQADLPREAEVQAAIRLHFQEESAEAREELRTIGYKGRWSFFLALAVVALLITVSEAVLRLGEGRFVTVLSESLIIIAWVSLWGPADTLFFSRFPVWRRRNLSRSLAEARVKLHARD